MCNELEIELNEIPDWNCCSASIGYAGGGELPRLALSARNMAPSDQHYAAQQNHGQISHLGPPSRCCPVDFVCYRP